jgi:hypothetical protein
MAQTKQKQYSFFVYAKEEPKQFEGILGKIDLYTVHMLLAGGKKVIVESFDGSAEKAVAWYTEYMKEQEIYFKSSKIIGTTIWMEVDLEKTPVNEFTQAHELEESDLETLAWKILWYPCTAGTKNECLGFAVSTHEYQISGVSLESVLRKII